MPRHLKLNSDGWLTAIRIHGRMLHSVKIPISKYSRLPHPVSWLATVGTQLAGLQTAPVHGICERSHRVIQSNEVYGTGPCTAMVTNRIV